VGKNISQEFITLFSDCLLTLFVVQQRELNQKTVGTIDKVSAYATDHQIVYISKKKCPPRKVQNVPHIQDNTFILRD